MAEWQPIETAPKNDKPPFEMRGPLLILGGHGWSGTGWWSVFERWCVGYEGGIDGQGDVLPPSEPTHWQPFPDPPLPPLSPEPKE